MLPKEEKMYNMQAIFEKVMLHAVNYMSCGGWLVVE
jgi:hypothetical protein